MKPKLMIIVFVLLFVFPLIANAQGDWEFPDDSVPLRETVLVRDLNIYWLNIDEALRGTYTGEIGIRTHQPDIQGAGWLLVETANGSYFVKESDIVPADLSGLEDYGTIQCDNPDIDGEVELDDAVLYWLPHVTYSTGVVASGTALRLAEQDADGWTAFVWACRVYYTNQ